MNDTIDVAIPLDAGVARGLDTQSQRDAAGRILSELLRDGHTGAALANAIAAAKREARQNNLTDADIDAELTAWRAGDDV